MDIEKLEKKVDKLEEKLDYLIKSIDEHLKPDTKKMSSHIDFIETIYDNIKNPLGYFVHKISYLKGNENQNHCIESEKFN